MGSEGDGQSQTDRAPGTGNLDDTGSVESDEQTSISVPNFISGALLVESADGQWRS
jgi:hypothetical protein